jgi:NADH dehydrogenase/NADH:ubiquinone oxidoreductase 75 kD subunit (chain G)
MVRLTIDGKVVEAEKGTSILEAADKVGIKIPTLCYIKDLLPDGSCRMCMVEVENRGRKN